MTKKISHIFSPSHCPSEKELLDYVKNRLDASRKHVVEAHLADCEMCSDYVEGLSLLPDADKIYQITIELNHKIDDVAGKKPKVRFFNMRNMSAAAAVLTILVVVTFVLNQQFKKTEHTETAQTISPYEEEMTEESIDQSDEMTFKETSVDGNEKVTPAIPETPTTQTGKEKESGDAPKSSLKPSTTSETIVQDSEVREDRTMVADVVDVTDDTDFFLVIAEESETQDEQKDKRSEAQGTSTTTRTSSKESQKLEAVMDESTPPSAAEANEGIVLYNEKKFEASLKYFESVLLKNPGDQTAQWYYALNLIALNRNNDAKAALNTIIQGGGPYKKQAEKELKKLK